MLYHQRKITVLWTWSSKRPTNILRKGDIGLIAVLIYTSCCSRWFKFENPAGGSCIFVIKTCFMVCVHYTLSKVSNKSKTNLVVPQTKYIHFNHRNHLYLTVSFIIPIIRSLCGIAIICIISGNALC